MSRRILQRLILKLELFKNIRDTIKVKSDSDLLNSQEQGEA